MIFFMALCQFWYIRQWLEVQHLRCSTCVFFYCSSEKKMCWTKIIIVCCKKNRFHPFSLNRKENDLQWKHYAFSQSSFIFRDGTKVMNPSHKTVFSKYKKLNLNFVEKVNLRNLFAFILFFCKKFDVTFYFWRKDIEYHYESSFSERIIISLQKPFAWFTSACHHLLITSNFPCETWILII